MTYYQQLNVGPDATTKEIKEAFRRLAFEYHPDRNAGDPSASDKMKAINEAYAVLSDPEKRRRYDALYRSYGESAGTQFKQTYSEQDIFRGSDIHQIFEEMARSFGLRGFDEIFKEYYGQGYRSFQFRQPGMFGRGFIFSTPFATRGNASAKTGLLGALSGSLLNKVLGVYLPRRGGDLHDTVVIQPEMARLGGPLAYFHRQRGKKLIVHIPAGVHHGQTIRLAGIGKQGTHGAQAGDLLLKVRIKTPLLKRLKKAVGGGGPSTNA
jgi:DnaJ-class molecular chaperone